VIVEKPTYESEYEPISLSTGENSGFPDCDELAEPENRPE
jgi:hypothetical protein